MGFSLESKVLRLQQQMRFLKQQYDCIRDKGCLCFTETPELTYDETTRRLTSKYANGQTASVILPASTTGGGNNPNLTQLQVFDSMVEALTALGPNQLFRFSTGNFDGVPSPSNSVIGVTN